jgi:hypothetical protein
VVVDVEESDDGVVDGVVDGVESSPPMFGQSLVEVAAMVVSSATAAVAGVDCDALPDELVAACATAPPASAAVAASVTMILRERGNICVHLLSVVGERSEPTPRKSNLCASAETSEEAFQRTSERARLVSQPPSTNSVCPLT